MSNNLVTTNYDFKCDICGAYMPFNIAHVDDHYNTAHTGRKSKYHEHTDLAAIFDYSKEHVNTRDITQFMQQVNAGDIESDSELSFIAPELIARARNFADAVDGRLYKFKTLADGKAHKILELGNGKQFDFYYNISPDERIRSARTLFDKDVNLNHYLYSPYFNFILDSDEVNGAVVGLMLIADPVINALYDQKLVAGVSVEYYRRNEVCACAGACECDHTGIVFTGMAVITVPFEPADGASQFVEVMHNEASERMISQVHDATKHAVTKFTKSEVSQVAEFSDGDEIANNLQLSNNNFDNLANGQTNKQGSACSAKQSRTDSASDNAASQPETLTNSENEMITDEQLNTKLAEMLAKSELAKQVTELASKVAKTDETINTMSKAFNTETFTKTITDTVKSAFTESSTSLNADVLELAKQVKTMREAFATGHNMPQKITFSKEEYADVLPARIAEASLAEVVEAVKVKA